MSVYSTRGDGSSDNLRVLINIFCKQREGLRVCHINAQSLYKKIDEFRNLFVGSNVDIVCISETWFDIEKPNSHYSLKGYKIFRADRQNRIGGGVAIYVRNTISAKLHLISPNDSPIEYCFLEIAGKNREKCLLGVVYRPNGYIDLFPLYNVLETVSSNFAKTIICGDFNCNVLSRECSESFVNSINTLGLKIVNLTIPTHFTGSTSTLLDLFLTSDSEDGFYSQASASAFSKHDLIFYTFIFACSKQQSKFKYRDFKNINAELLEQDLRGIDWQPIYNETSTDRQVNYLQNTVLHLFDVHVPFKTKVLRYSSIPWFSDEIYELKNKRDAAFTKWKRYRLSEFLDVFRQLRNLVNSKIRLAKMRFYANHFNAKLPSKKLWKNLREVGIGRQMNNEMNDIDPNQLNREFVRVQSTSHQYTQPSRIAHTSNVSFDFQRVEQVDVVRAILDIRSKAVGIDGIHPIFIKIILPYLLPAITYVFNNILTTSTFPSAWKTSKIVPILKKKASAHSPAEYRPIAILPFLSKVLEKLVHRQMSAFLKRKNLLCSNQSGFRRSHSCTTALLKVTEDLRIALDNDMVTFLTLLDFSKAFDTVNHGRLISKLEMLYFFSSAACNLISTYLHGRKQAVVANDVASEVIGTSTGVPQGSILGPLLFTLFINDLPRIVKNSCIHMYADDVQLYVSCKLGLVEDAAYKLNEDLQNIRSWSEENSLMVNPCKSKCLIINRTKLNIDYFPTIYYGNSPIEFVEKAKNLGLWFNCTLDWDTHVCTVIGRIYSSLRNLSMSQHFTPVNTKLMLVRSLLIPTITYGCEIFHCYNANTKRKLNVAFNNVTRYVYGLRRYDHVSTYAKNILGCTLDIYLDFCTLKFLHKIIISKQPKYLFEKINFSQSNRSISLIPPRVSYQVSERQFFVNAIRLWNSLPLRIKRLYNRNNFCDILFQHLSGNSSS